MITSADPLSPALTGSIIRESGRDWRHVAQVISVLVVIGYTFLGWYLHKDQLEGDEQRYYQDAVNLTQGYFVADDHPRIFNGPGYPFLLYPFVKLGAPIMAMRLMGAIMVGAGCWFFFLAGRRVMPESWAVVLATYCSIHPNLLKHGHTLMTEPTTQVCLAVFLWCLLTCFQSEKSWWKWALGASLSIWWLTMTRVFMGHVITVMIPACLVLLLFRPMRQTAARMLLVMSTAFLLCVPYLSYTYSKTGSPLLWSTSAGELLYWVTSSDGGENGHWYHEDEVYSRPELAVNHAAFFKRIQPLGPLEREAEFKKVAVQRVKNHPLKFLKNWICNVSRLFFGFPRSLEVEKLTTLPLMMFNGSLLVGLLIGGLLAYMRRSPLSPPLVILLCMAAFYSGGSSLAPALPRYFLGIVPVIALITLTLLSRVPWAALWQDARR